MSKVLLINDSKFECIIIKDILNTMGHDVKVSDEYNAMNQVKTYGPDFLIANYIMKEIRGDQLIALVKLSNSNIKCILSSSNDISEKDFEHKHIDAVIHTPIDKAGLAKVFKRIGNDDNAGYTDGKIPQEEKQENEVNSNDGADHEFDIIKFCPFCGHKLTEKDGEPIRFCAFCGHML